ncbi:glycoside hydrolase family 65 protein [Peribacillus muralis]|uniref:glycoside hydrolase family 65 protein n=1 Tax=Peribacillus muralis TaxID=264697 RepID=UPI001F4DDF55|nr:glycoside hydrolase family 65 protein [Peribacillus muralis]MCK1992784.1 glycoside hydrolase family 65 protein [Peribacillus muralis]MCK2013339.1 glycoside hydrolase family 65 protein [Peribacillus muralis]
MKKLDENTFDPRYINKFASLMTAGNGYLGLRASHEENYVDQTRGMYVAGIYNKATANEPSDLVNLPDMVGMTIEFDGEVFSLLTGEILSYKRQLNLENGELRRDILWKSPAGSRFRLTFQRFAAKNDLHVLATKLTVTSLDKPAQMKIVTGINAQQTNFGRQHLIEEKVRVKEGDLLQGIYKTTESGHTIALAACCTFSANAEIAHASKNRQLLSTIKLELQVDTPSILEKMAVVFTSLDGDLRGESPEVASEAALRSYSVAGYDALLHKSAGQWAQFWKEKRIKVASTRDFDQLAIDFSLYQLEIMTPAHDERFSVGAKGLTGEGYKGHVFWDTEIFITPFHLFTEPEKARKLLRYRYLRLKQAMGKAAANGYEGALFPWESAFTGEEETPEFAAINIKTGKRQKVASALAEHHIVADIAYTVVKYYQNTLDETFMKKEGLELLKETSRFWISRAVEETGQLVIKDVIGPDEYTEHVNNNAFTNYMAWFNVEQALFFMEKYGDHDHQLKERGHEFLNRLYLPKANDHKIIPQDDTFLSKPEIDLSRYKKAQGSQGILMDYSRQEVNEMQILKQADVVMLLYLLPDLFSQDVISENLHYYEEHTIHDSSLSKAIHAIVAARAGDIDKSYEFFQESCLIDLGPNPQSSDEGLHAASLGAIWMAAIFGFANVSIKNQRLSLDPKLPSEWSELAFPIMFQGSRLHIALTHKQAVITKVSGDDVCIELNGTEFLVTNKVEVELQYI